MRKSFPFHSRFLRQVVWGDFRYNARILVRSPVFSCTVIISLAIVIGASTSIFTAADALLFRPLRVKDPKALVTFSLQDSRGRARTFFPLAFADRLEASGAFSDVVGVNIKPLSFIYDDHAERITAEVVTPNFFSAFGLRTVLGRGFSPGVPAGNWSPEAVLSYSFWKTRFQGDPRVLGRTVRLNTYPFTIVGVSPSDFFDVHQGRSPDIRIPVLPTGQHISEIELLAAEQDFDLIARLAPRVSRAEAQAVADVQLHEFARTGSDRRFANNSYGRMVVYSGERGWPELEKDYEAPVVILLLLMLGATLIACANVASMTLARAIARAHEFAVRSSLGATRAHLIAQILTESLLLSWCSFIMALGVTHWVTRLLVHFLPQRPVRLVLDLRLDAESVVFAFGLCTLAALIFGFITAMQSIRAEVASLLKRNPNAVVGNFSRSRRTLIVVQVALSAVLLVVAGLFTRTVLRLYPVTYYSYANQTLTFGLQPQQELYSPDRIRNVVAEFIRRASSVPGVQAAGMAENGPFAVRGNRDVVQVSGSAPLEVTSDVVSPGFLNAIGLSILSGRDFNYLDKPGAPRVIIVSRSVAETLFPGKDSVGRDVQLLSARATRLYPTNGVPSFRVIGVIPDVVYADPRHLTPLVFFTFQTDPPYLPTLYVRVEQSNPDVFLPVIRREFDAVDKGLPVFNVRTLDAQIDDAIGRERMIAALALGLGALSLVLVGIGLYGTLAFSVARRTREIGLRIALGSTMTGVLWLVWREALILLGLGTAVGFIISVIASRLLKSALYRVPPADPATLLAATTILLAIAVVATSVPALRASRIHPGIALRSE